MRRRSHAKFTRTLTRRLPVSLRTRHCYQAPINTEFFGPGKGSPMATNVVVVVAAGVLVLRFSIP